MYKKDTEREPRVVSHRWRRQINTDDISMLGLLLLSLFCLRRRIIKKMVHEMLPGGYF